MAVKFILLLKTQCLFTDRNKCANHPVLSGPIDCSKINLFTKLVKLTQLVLQMGVLHAGLDDQATVFESL